MTGRPPAPAGLEDSGAALWRGVTARGKLGPLERVLLLEACRTVDRLDRLDALLRGEGAEWVRLAEEMDGRSEVAMVVDGVLGEARQQAGRLTSILAELRLRMAAAGAAGKTPAAPAGEGVPSGVAGIIGAGRRLG